MAGLRAHGNGASGVGRGCGAVQLAGIRWASRCRGGRFTYAIEGAPAHRPGRKVLGLSSHQGLLLKGGKAGSRGWWTAVSRREI